MPNETGGAFPAWQQRADCPHQIVDENGAIITTTDPKTAALIVSAVNACEPDQARIAELEAALRIIAEFPFTDPKNMDAENMAAIARAALGGLSHD